MKKTTILETAVFFNEKTSPFQPDLAGSVETLIGKLSIGLWAKTSKTGKSYYALQITKIKNDELQTKTNN